MSRHPDFSLVAIVPTHNEGGIITETLRLLVAWFTATLPIDTSWTIVIADNGSRTADAATTETTCQQFGNRVRYLPITTPGRGNALRETVRQFTAARTIFIDADLPVELDDLTALLLPLERGTADIVVGKRSGTRPWHRRAMTYIWARFMLLTAGVTVSDAQCGVLAINHRAAKLIDAECRENRWCLNSELLIVGKWRGLAITEVPVRWIEQRYATRPTTVRIVHDTIAGLSFFFRMARRRMRSVR